MSRIRTLKPEFFRSRSLARCSLAARLTFQGMWCEADDHGRGIADPRLLAAAIWPLEDEMTPEEVVDHLEELAGTGHIRLYGVEGETYYEVVKWEKHQAAAYRRGEAIHPAPPAETPAEQPLHDQSCKKVQDARSVVLEGKGTGNREQGTLGPVSALPGTDGDPVFASFWTAYPKKVDKGAARRAWRSAIKKTEPSRIIEAAGAYAKDPTRADPYTKNPASWLNAEAWENSYIRASGDGVSYETPPPRFV